MQVMGPGFCCALHTMSGVMGGGSAVSSSRYDTSPAALRDGSGPPSACSGVRGVRVDADALRPLQRHIWRSSTVLGNGFNAQWGVEGARRPRAASASEQKARPCEDAHVLASRPELTVLRVCIWSASSVRLGAAGGNPPREWHEPSTLPSVKEAGQASDVLLATAAVPLLSLRGGLRAFYMTHPRGGEPIDLCSILCHIGIDEATDVPFDSLDGDGAAPTISRPRGRARQALPLPGNLVRRLMRRASTTSVISAPPARAADDGRASYEDEPGLQSLMQSSLI